MKTLQNVLRESLLSNMDDTLDNMEAVTGIIANKATRNELQSKCSGGWWTFF